MKSSSSLVREIPGCDPPCTWKNTCFHLKANGFFVHVCTCVCVFLCVCMPLCVPCVSACWCFGVIDLNSNTLHQGTAFSRPHFNDIYLPHALAHRSLATGPSNLFSSPSTVLMEKDEGLVKEGRLKGRLRPSPLCASQTQSLSPSF